MAFLFMNIFADLCLPLECIWGHLLIGLYLSLPKICRATKYKMSNDGKNEDILITSPILFYFYDICHLMAQCFFISIVNFYARVVIDSNAMVHDLQEKKNYII
ncbi:hypothetical protein QQ045_013246 [Rhodiola kirilowii]